MLNNLAQFIHNLNEAQSGDINWELIGEDAFVYNPAKSPILIDLAGKRYTASEPNANGAVAYADQLKGRVWSGTSTADAGLDCGQLNPFSSSTAFSLLVIAKPIAGTTGYNRSLVSQREAVTGKYYISCTVAFNVSDINTIASGYIGAGTSGYDVGTSSSAVKSISAANQFDGDIHTWVLSNSTTKGFIYRDGIKQTLFKDERILHNTINVNQKFKIGASADSTTTNGCHFPTYLVIGWPRQIPEELARFLTSNPAAIFINSNEFIGDNIIGSILKTAGLGAVLQKLNTKTSGADARLLRQNVVRNISLQAQISKYITTASGVDAKISKSVLRLIDADALLLKNINRSVGLQSQLSKLNFKYTSMDARLLKSIIKVISNDARLQKLVSINANLNAVISKQYTNNVNLDSRLQKAISMQAALDSFLVTIGTVLLNSNLDARLKKLGVSKIIGLDSRIAQLSNLVTNEINAVLSKSLTSIVSFDSRIVGAGGNLLFGEFDAILQVIRTNQLEMDALLIRLATLYADMDALVVKVHNKTVSLSAYVRKVIRLVDTYIELSMEAMDGNVTVATLTSNIETGAIDDNLSVYE